MTGGIITLSNLFLYCYFGILATESYEEIGFCLFEANWQDLHVELQKYVIIMIADAQKPLEYHGFGVSVLNLTTFNKVLIPFNEYYEFEIIINISSLIEK